MNIRKFAVSRTTALAVALAGALSASQPSAHAAVAGLISPSILGGLNQTLSTGGSSGYTAGVRLGFGLAILEVDGSAMFLSRGSSIGSNVNYIQIPLMLRYSLIPMLSLGAGGYYDVPITSNAASVYGIRGALMLSLPGLPLYGEANYSYNLGTSAVGGGAGDLTDFQLLIGFKI
jgi:hypothetical protein